MIKEEHVEAAKNPNAWVAAVLMAVLSGGGATYFDSGNERTLQERLQAAETKLAEVEKQNMAQWQTLASKDLIQQLMNHCR